MLEPVIKRRKTGDQTYAVLLDDRAVGEASKTGTYLDHYPWDWMLLDGIAPHIQANGYRYKATGVADTLRSAVEQIAAAAGAYKSMEAK